MGKNVKMMLSSPNELSKKRVLNEHSSQVALQVRWDFVLFMFLIRLFGTSKQWLIKIMKSRDENINCAW
jgi:hypothetical protein